MQYKDSIKIDICRLCKSKNLIKVFDLGTTPLANSYCSKIKSLKLKKYPLALNLCKNCGHLQLSISVEPKKMFQNYLYKTNTSKKNYDHFKKYYLKVSKLFKTKNIKVLDIASNDGTFLNFFNSKKCLKVGIDPAKNLQTFAKRKGINQICDFFTYKNSFYLKKKFTSFDLITANHVCAHVANLEDFFRGVSNIIQEKGYFIFEVSYRGSVIKKNTFDTIYHEHHDYHALRPLKKFVTKFGFKIVDFDILEAQGGSIRLYCTKNKNAKLNTVKIKKQINYETNKIKLFDIKTYKLFKGRVDKAKKEFKKIIENLMKRKLIIIGYGAAAKTTTFMNYFKINEKQIKYIYDDNELKQNLYMPGKNIKIINKKKMLSTKVNVLVILAWNYADFIIKKNITFRKKGGKFLIPFPKPKIV